MPRVRKRHLQQELRYLDKNGQHRGRRKGDGVKVGRKPKHDRPGAPHKARPHLKASCPVHIVLRVHRAVGSLRKRHMYRALREATIRVALRELHFAETGWFRIVHVSIQRTHVHLLVEAAHKMALSRGMQAFQISAAKHINRAYSEHARLAERRRGSVFPDRFHQEIITNPRQARHALAYVLNNWRKHAEDRERRWNVDPYSTGALFVGWRARAHEPFLWRTPPTYDPLVVYLPRTWLLQEGWKRYGYLEYAEVPRVTPLREGARRTARAAASPGVARRS